MVTIRKLWNVFEKVNLASVCIAGSHDKKKLLVLKPIQI